MSARLKALWEKYKSLINYAIFGVATTIINIVVYAVTYNGLGISNVTSNIIAWIVSVLFAFVTNKLLVFESKSMEAKVVLYEAFTFFGCRLATGIMDVAIMYVTVDVLKANSTLMKCLSNVIVIVANYVASKLVIFKSK